MSRLRFGRVGSDEWAERREEVGKEEFQDPLANAGFFDASFLTRAIDKYTLKKVRSVASPPFRPFHCFQVVFCARCEFVINAAFALRARQEVKGVNGYFTWDACMKHILPYLG